MGVRLLVFLLISLVVALPLNRLYDTVKGKFVVDVMDFENDNTRFIYSIVQHNGVIAVLVVKEAEFLTMPPNSLVRAPVVELGRDVYELVGPLRPLLSDGNMNVGNEGVEGRGISFADVAREQFVKGEEFVKYGAKDHHKIQTLVKGDRTAAVVGINFKSKNMKATMEQINQWMFDGEDNVNKLYDDCTNGQVKFPKSKSVVAGPFTVDDPVKRGSTEWMAEVKQLCIDVLKKNNIDANKYHHLIMILPDFSPEDDGASGLAPVGCDGFACPVWINTNILKRAVTAIAHELGHNFGWSHARVLEAGGFNVPKPRSNVEAAYGDMTGIMGNGPPVCPNLPHQLTQKWITNTILVGESKDNVALAPLGVATPNAVQGVILLTKPVQAFISFRFSAKGPDSRFKNVDQEGKGQWSDKVYVHLDPNGRTTINIARISVGETFTNEKDKYSVTFLSMKDGVAYIRIIVTDKKDCESNPCGANGQCIEQIGGYTCQCNKNFMGPSCSEPVCYKYKTSGFGELIMLDTEWERVEDYGGRLAYQSDQYAIFFVAPNRWVAGPAPAGGSGYYVSVEADVDSPGYVGKKYWESGNRRYEVTFTCLSTTPLPPVPDCEQIKGEGFLPENNLNVVFNKRAPVNGKAAYTSPSGLNIFFNGEKWTTGLDVNSDQIGALKTSEVRGFPHAVKKWEESMKALQGRYIVSKGVFKPLTCNSGSERQDCTGDWSDWSQCSAQCGGVQSRTYKIRLPAKNGGAICNTADNEVQQRSCGPTCSTPIDCVGEWSSWSSCSTTCGQGVQTRRYQIRTTPSNGGKPCSNADGETSTSKCDNKPCQAAPAPTPINCVGDWYDYGTCSVSCGGGEILRVYKVNKVEANGGTKCPVEDGKTKREICNTNACPAAAPSVNCKGSWSVWTSCSATCGGGKQSRIYSIDVLAQNGGKPCDLVSGAKEEQNCNPQPCNNGGSGSKPTSVDCIGIWSAWGTCTKTCGVGKTTRTYQITQEAVGNGIKCDHVNGATQYTDCNTLSCIVTPGGGAKVDCRGGYTNWQECSKACGPGQQSRTFYVTTQAQNGGAQCPLADRTTETQPCIGTKCSSQIEDTEVDKVSSGIVSPMTVIGCVGMITIALVVAVIIVRSGKRSRLINEEVYFSI